MTPPRSLVLLIILVLFNNIVHSGKLRISSPGVGTIWNVSKVVNITWTVLDNAISSAGSSPSTFDLIVNKPTGLIRVGPLVTLQQVNKGSISFVLDPSIPTGNMYSVQFEDSSSPVFTIINKDLPATSALPTSLAAAKAIDSDNNNSNKNSSSNGSTQSAGLKSSFSWTTAVLFFALPLLSTGWIFG